MSQQSPRRLRRRPPPGRSSRGQGRHGRPAPAPAASSAPLGHLGRSAARSWPLLVLLERVVAATAGEKIAYSDLRSKVAADQVDEIT